MKNTTIFEKLKNGEVVSAEDPDRPLLRDASFNTISLLNKMNKSSNPEEIRDLLGQITGQTIDSTTTLFPPLFINNGKHTSIGKNVFINFNCTFLDLGGIIIEDEVMIAPNVCLLTEGHPLNPKERHGLISKPIHIKRNAWIGANVTILQGVCIGENSVIAAGAVVKSDVPPNTIVGGIPAKVLKTIESNEPKI